MSITKYILPVYLLLSFLAIGQNITVDNTTPRLDDTGNIVDAHDGRIIQFGDTFYWYGTSYASTNGFTTQNHYRCYSSKDLTHWKYEGKLLENQPEGVYYRPHVIYNKKTKTYILWYNWYPKLWDGQFGVATSNSPQGPFEIVNDNVEMYNSKIGLGDFGLFVDDDETAYISYNTIQNHQVSVEKLKDDYLSSTLENGGTISQHMEAGTMFKKDGKYYLLTDYTCCFCNYGSGARVYISDKPLSGYTLTTNINRYPGTYAAILKDEVTRGTLYETLSKQDNGFDAIEIVFETPTNIDAFTVQIFTGNRPENCGNVENPKVHPNIITPEFEIYTWTYNQWQKIDIESHNVIKSALNEQVKIEFKNTYSSRFKIIPKAASFPYENLYLNEVAASASDKHISLSEASVYLTGQKIPQKPIIPAQQSYVMKLNTKTGEQYIWIGDLWGSASDNIKGHDYQYWSAPLHFNDDGTIKPMQWTDQWSVKLKKN